MADRFPLIANSSANQIQEIPSGDQLNLSGNNIANAGVVTATTFSGSGASLTNLNGSNIASGTVPVARIGTGTKSTSTFYRGDGTFQVVNTDLVADTSPQLGGDLDTNSHNISLDDDHKVKFGNSDDLQIYHSGSHAFLKNFTGSSYLDTTGNFYVRNNAGSATYMYASGNEVALYHTGNKKFETSSTGVSVTGNVLPASDNSSNLGSSTLRWANIYSADIHCSNKGSKNDVDGTWGDYTIQEGETELYLLNNRNGKKYKFNLTEVN